MTELLFEIGCEEIPASYIEPALSWLHENVQKEFEKARLSFSQVESYSTPRRFVLVVSGLSKKQSDIETEILGPRSEMAYDHDAELTKQALGFLAARNIDPKNAYRKLTPKGEVLAAKLFEEGKQAIALLPEILERLIKGMPFPKVMRWEPSGALFARPVRWLLCLVDGKEVPITFADVKSSNMTTGHRFLSPEFVPVSDARHYLELMRKKYVMLSTKERRTVILEKAKEIASRFGGTLVEDDALLDIVQNLVEYPWPLLGTFEERYLSIPKEILICEMREHQKYFAIENNNGSLLAGFIVVAGSLAKNDKAVADGHARVLRARFEDGAFYYEEDLEHPLERFVEKLKTVQFQRELGTVYEKTERIEKLAEVLGTHLSYDSNTLAHTIRAAKLAKSDLVSGVVSQFPELQGVMGAYYAKNKGEDEKVVQGIAEHYCPRFSKDNIPVSLEGCLVALADKIDTLVGIIGIGKMPKGNADPYALRRAAIGVSRILIERGMPLTLTKLIDSAIVAYGDKLKISNELKGEMVAFVLGRARGLFAAPMTIVDGAMAVGADNLSDLTARIDAVNQTKETDSHTFLELAAALKRASNIVNKARADGILHASSELDASLLETPSEKNLYDQLVKMDERSVAENLTKEQLKEHYVEVMKKIAELKPLVDRFFDEVMVMVDNVSLRTARLCLLRKLQSAANQIADFTRIQM